MENDVEDAIALYLSEYRCYECDYQLPGTLAERGTTCPECGEPISSDIIERWRANADSRTDDAVEDSRH